MAELDEAGRSAPSPGSTSSYSDNIQIR